MTTKTCAHCKYWTGGSKGPFRQCTRRAPSQTKSVDVQGDGVRIERAIWPWTKDVESCGEWTGKAEEVLTEIDQKFREAQAEGADPYAVIETPLEVKPRSFLKGFWRPRE